jgi:hypothetical protein
MKNNSIFLCCLLIIAFGCRRQINTPRIKPSTPYLLVAETWSGVPSDGLYFTFSYNSDNLVSKMTVVGWAGEPSQIQYDTAITYFEYTNGLVTRSWNAQSGPDYYTGYQYNRQGQLIKSIYFGDEIIGDSGYAPEKIFKNVPMRYFSYNYDSNNNLIHVLDYNPDGLYNFEYVFSYNDTNNLISSVCYTYGESLNRVQQTKEEWTAFDNHVNFAKALNGFPAAFIWNNNLGIYSSSSPNNIQSENYYPPAAVNQSFGSLIQFSYSYEYNDAGLPVTIYDGPWIVTLQYQKI